MKTGELIKLLQRDLPSGELHVRINGKTPTIVETKSGYWDGPYQYLDENKNLIISIAGSKVDIYTTDYEDFIWDHEGDYSKIKFEGFEQYIEENRNINDWKRRFEEISQEAIKSTNKIYQSIYNETKIYLDQGYFIREDKTNVWKSEFIKNKRKHKSRPFVSGHISLIRKGWFNKIKETKKYIYWGLKNG